MILCTVEERQAEFRQFMAAFGFEVNGVDITVTKQIHVGQLDCGDFSVSKAGRNPDGSRLLDANNNPILDSLSFGPGLDIGGDDGGHPSFHLNIGTGQIQVRQVDTTTLQPPPDEPAP